MGATEHMEAGFMARGGLRASWAWVAVRMGRLPFAAVLAIVPALLVLAAAALLPAGFLGALTRPENVHATFARFINGIATASSIAVSVAALTLRRDLSGIRDHERRHDSNVEYRRKAREHLGESESPILIGPFLVAQLEGIAACAAESRRALPPAAAEAQIEGVFLASYLERLERRARSQAVAVRAAGMRPDRLLVAALDMENEITKRLAHRFARDETLAPEVRERIERLTALLSDHVLAQKYLKTLDTQWGLSQMSVAILVSTIPSIAMGALMVLTYGAGAVDAVGELGAAALVCGALAVVLFPIACFVSFLLRFLVINENTLPTEGFLLGPEAKLLTR